MNKPVAWRVQNPQMFNDWITFPTQEQADLYAFHNGKGNLPEPLYTHPHPDNLGLAESIIKQHQLKIDSLLENNARLDAEIEVLKSHPVKELTDEDLETITEALLMIGFSDAFINYDLKEKALAILRKAQEQ